MWHARRKLLSPTFHKDLLKEYLKTTVKEVDILIYCLQEEVGKTAFNILPYTKRAALDIICSKYLKFKLFSFLILFINKLFIVIKISGSWDKYTFSFASF